MQGADFQVLITAQEAWPAFERAVLNARSHVRACFRIFDLSTKLRSDAARATGESWFDLLSDALSRGVRIDLTISDFDPVFATDLHRLTWKTMRQVAALREISDCPPDRLRVRASLHPAKAGRLPWVAFLPAALSRRSKRLRALTEAQLSREAVRLAKARLPGLHTCSHHQKIAVIDDELLYIGGLDLNERRFDEPTHERVAAQTWSDVQLMLRGPEAAEAAAHLDTFLETVHTGAPPPALDYIRRTISAPRKIQFPFLSPRTILSEVEQDHRAAFEAARHLIYIETQFFRARRLADHLARQGRKRPDLATILILPGLPDEVAFSSDLGTDARYGLALQHEALSALQDGFGDRLILATPVAPRMAARDTVETLAGSPLIHVHNKVLLKDDDFALVGSANLNGRSLFWDTEAALRITSPARLATLRKRLMAHWWFSPLPDKAQSPENLFPWWSDKIRENGVLSPENRHGFLVPHDASALQDAWLKLPGVTENIV